MRLSRLSSWLENVKTATRSMAQSRDRKGSGDETFAADLEHTHFIHHDSALDSCDDSTGKDAHNLFDKHFSFHRRRSPVITSTSSSSSKDSRSSKDFSSSKGSSESQDPSASHSTTAPSSSSGAESTNTTPRTSISTAPRASFPCVCRMPSCPLCHAASDTKLAQLQAAALADPDDFRISITKSATGFSVKRDYASEAQARRDLTPRTAKFYETAVKVRSSSWPQSEREQRVRLKNVDYKAAKVAARERSLSQKARWRRESELTWYLADMDEYDEGVAPEHVVRVPRKQGNAVPVEELLAKERRLGWDEFDRLAKEAKAKRTAYEYNIFKDEDYRGFLGDEPL
ncbi:hypothetical protein BU16DRAFT_555906 [Lophium mytilinum]|uniref:Uncharacterized protein n=1 Tax=Lophium mytilinum TaxID=390894 RepID=A0A6A6RCG5_9PEZI|nr:hypothetical protein BU16DRAFT_555906 [Lophium mytilinum]